MLLPRSRITKSLILASALSFSAIGCKKADPDSDSAGISYRLNPQHTGSISGGGLQLPLRQRWAVDLNANISYPLVTRTAVHVLAPGSVDPVLRTFDITTGQLLWSASQFTKSYTSHITYDSGKVFALGDEGDLVAFDAKTGEKLWTQDYGEPSFSYNFDAPPTASLGNIYLTAYDRKERAIAIDEETGEILFQTDRTFLDSAPAVTKDAFYIGGPCKSLMAFSTIDGSNLWSVSGPCTGGSETDAVVGDGYVYASDSTQSGIVVDLAGNVLREASSLVQVPVHGEYGVFVNGAAGGCVVSYVHMATGEASWTYPLRQCPSEAPTVMSAPMIVNGFVLVHDGDGFVVALDEKTGARMWSDNLTLPLRGRYYAIPRADLGTNGDVIVIPTGDRMAVFEKTDSSQLPTDNYKSQCDAPGNHFYIEGDASRAGPNGVDLKNGNPGFEGEMAIDDQNGTLSVSGDYTPEKAGLNHIQATAIINSPQETSEWTIELSSPQSSPLQPGIHSETMFDNPRSSAGDGSDTPWIIIDQPHSSGCGFYISQFEIKELEGDAAGVRKFSANFVQHCNGALAATRGCIKWEKPTP